jgi:hypothetical protein
MEELAEKLAESEHGLDNAEALHAVVEEAGAGEFAGEEIEIRLGTAKFESELDLIVITDGRTDHTVPMDSIVRWYKPMEFTHG